VRALKDSQAIDASPQPSRDGTRNPTGERPVTARIRERRGVLVTESSRDEADEVIPAETEPLGSTEGPTSEAIVTAGLEPTPTSVPARGRGSLKQRRLF